MIHQPQVPIKFNTAFRRMWSTRFSDPKAASWCSNLMAESDFQLHLQAMQAENAPVYLSRWGRTAGGDGSWVYCSHNVPLAQVTRSRMLFLFLLHFFVRWRKAVMVDHHGGEWINPRFPLNKSRKWDLTVEFVCMLLAALITRTLALYCWGSTAISPALQQHRGPLMCSESTWKTSFSGILAVFVQSACHF